MGRFGSRPGAARVADGGGPARMLTEERDCSVHGITISKVQAREFAAQVPRATVSVADAQELDLEPIRDDADVAIMLESLTHMPRPDLVLRSLRPPEWVARGLETALCEYPRGARLEKADQADYSRSLWGYWPEGNHLRTPRYKKPKSGD